jgi:hypothetical protein
MAYALFFNLPVSSNLINRTDNLLGSMLKFDENMKTGLTYRRYLKKIDAIVSVGYHFREMLDITAPKQAFETLFYGNARFEGDTANLSNVNLEFYEYNQYSAGIFKTINYGKYQMELGLEGSFLQGIDQQQIQTANNTWLYTAPYGQSLTLNYNLTYNAETGGAPKFFGNSGFGGSGDFHFGLMNQDKWKVTFDLSDFGVMGFRKSPVNYTGANVDSFQGIVIPNITNLSNLANLNIDSTLTSKLPSKTNNQYTIFLPFNAQVAFSKPLMHDRLVLTFGVTYRYIPGYYVYGYAKVNYFLKPDMVISVSAGSGGYSLFNPGLEFSKSWKYFDFTVGSSNMLGLVLPSYYPGTGIYLRLASSF